MGVDPPLSYLELRRRYIPSLTYTCAEIGTSCEIGACPLGPSCLQPLFPQHGHRYSLAVFQVPPVYIHTQHVGPGPPTITPSPRSGRDVAVLQHPRRGYVRRSDLAGTARRFRAESLPW